MNLNERYGAVGQRAVLGFHLGPTRKKKKNYFEIILRDFRRISVKWKRWRNKIIETA